jgi:hypothetical protein
MVENLFERIQAKGRVQRIDNRETGSSLARCLSRAIDNPADTRIMQPEIVAYLSRAVAAARVGSAYGGIPAMDEA